MRFGIKTIDDFEIKDKTILCRVDINQPVDHATGTLKSTTRIEACVPPIKELSDKAPDRIIHIKEAAHISL